MSFPLRFQGATEWWVYQRSVPLFATPVRGPQWRWGCFASYKSFVHCCSVKPQRSITRTYFLPSDFQNFLRTQTGNTTTVNIIISTVDYLLRLQVCEAQIQSCRMHTHTLPSSVSANVILFFRNQSVTSTGTTPAKMSSMRPESSTSPKLYLLPSRFSTHWLSIFR